MIDPDNFRQHPNVVLFCTDQQRADYLGCGGHPVLRTPHIDSILGNGGVQFSRCYVSSPQCMPNRATMMTGRMPSVHGVRTNGVSLSHRANTFVQLMGAEGYRTALVGKSHLQTMLGAAPELTPETVKRRRSGALREYADAWKSDIRDDAYLMERGDYRIGSPRYSIHDYYGFSHVDLCTMHGDMAGGDYYDWLRRRVPDVDRKRGPENSLPHDYVCPQAWRTAIPEKYYSTRYIQDKSVEWLSTFETRREERPFFLMVSFPDPHHPFTPPGKYWDMYDPARMPIPRSFHAGPGATPFGQYVIDHSRKAGASEYKAFKVDERELREAMALTCGMIAMIDDAVGAVLRTLRENVSRPTVIIFTSDHGDLMGDHGMLLKGPFHYQSLIRVPLLWQDPLYPQSNPRVINDLVGSIDLSATILDRVGISPYYGLQGQSYLPGIRGEPSRMRRSSFLIEEEQLSGIFDETAPLRVRTVVTQNHRLTIYSGRKWGELFDLENDPDEIVNLWDDPSTLSIKSELLEELAQCQAMADDPSPIPMVIG